MEYIPARAAKVGLRCPARVVGLLPFGLSLTVDLTSVAPGWNPSFTALLMFGRSVGSDYARGLAVGERFEGVLIEDGSRDWPLVSLPANPEWLAWNNGTVRHLARRIRESGETVLLPVLGDALEDAGCGDTTLLEHCREELTEERSWAVELLAAQE